MGGGIVGMIRTGIILTTYNRPTLVVDAIESVLEQEPQDYRLYIVDDGCDAETRAAIRRAIGRYPLTTLSNWQKPVVWWQGPQRTMEERKASIPYSRTINIALNYLLSDEQYVTYLCDDDMLLPGSIAKRVDYLDAHPDVSVVYGRLSSVQYDVGGFNAWQQSVRPQAGRAWIAPDGKRVVNDQVGNARSYFLNGTRDPLTGLDYVEEGFWQPGPFVYGERYRCDHNQTLHRRSCLDDPRPWRNRVAAVRTHNPVSAICPDGFIEYWPEGNEWGVGDAGFFAALGSVWPFVGVDCWAARKRYHSASMGLGITEVRE